MTKEKFKVVGIREEDTRKLQTSLSFWKDVFMRFRKNKLAMVGVVVLFLLIVYGYLWTIYDRL